MDSPSNHNPHKASIHHVLSHIYATYFVFFLVGVSLDIIFQLKMFSGPFMNPVGFTLLVLATFMIFWAQKTGRDLRGIKEDLKKEHFCRGPYCYTRIPTQWGLTLLMLGFGIFCNAFFVVLSTIVSFIVSQFVFMSKHDRILIEKYGSSYLEYKKMFKF
jgi:protein-S-isoprenylcysteine O-methyltransferase Ste14